METRDLIIIGAGNVGGFIVNNLEEFSQYYNVIGFLDDDISKIGQEVWGYKVLGPIKDIEKHKGICVGIGLASPIIKKEIVEKLNHPHFEFPSFVSKNAWLSKDVIVGKGSIIYPGVSINYSSIIGDFVVINMNCALGHHATVSSYSALAPGVNFGGYTFLEECVDMGIGAATIQKVRIGKNSVIGGQCMLIKDVVENSKVVGVPGKLLNQSAIGSRQ